MFYIFFKKDTKKKKIEETLKVKTNTVKRIRLHKN